VVQELVRRGRISPDEAASDPRRHIVLQAIGIDTEDLDVETASVPLRSGDRVVFATDGLFGMLKDDETLRGLLVEYADGDAACDALIGAANAAGGQDNITVVLVDVDGGPSAVAAGLDDEVQIDRGPPTPPAGARTTASTGEEGGAPGRFPRSAIVIGGAAVLLLAMLAAFLLRPTGTNYVVAARGENVVLLDGKAGDAGERAEGKVIRRFSEKTENFAETTQDDLVSGFEVESIAEAQRLIDGLPKLLGTPTPKPKPSSSPKPSATPKGSVSP
jgi:hypothetical protein